MDQEDFQAPIDLYGGPLTCPPKFSLLHSLLLLNIYDALLMPFGGFFVILIFIEI